MKEPRKRRKLAEDIWAHRDDPGEWSEEPEIIEVKPGRMELVSFRIPSDELDVLQEAAAQTGESLSEFVRTAVAIRLGRSGAANSAEVMTSGIQQITIQGPMNITLRRDWNTAPTEGELVLLPT